MGKEIEKEREKFFNDCRKKEDFSKRWDDFIQKFGYTSIYSIHAINNSGSFNKPNRGETYSDFIAEKILKDKPSLALPKIQDLAYLRERNGEKIGACEEKVQRQLAKNWIIGGPFGRFVTFEFTLMGHGKGFDLVTYDDKNKSLCFIELKAGENKDSILHGALELESYFETVDFNKLRDELSAEENRKKYGQIAEFDSKKSRKVLYLPQDSVVYKKYCEKDALPQVKKLVEYYGVEILTYDQSLV